MFVNNDQCLRDTGSLSQRYFTCLKSIRISAIFIITNHQQQNYNILKSLFTTVTRERGERVAGARAAARHISTGDDSRRYLADPSAPVGRQQNYVLW